MLKLKLTKDASSFISTRQPKHQRQLVTKIQELRINPEPFDSISMTGKIEFRRADCGEYRIIYRSDEETLYVAAVGKRYDDEVYRKFMRK
jgi:mRNA interferase RelE/StbE